MRTNRYHYIAEGLEQASLYGLLSLPIHSAHQAIGSQVVGPTGMLLLGVSGASSVLVVCQTTCSTKGGPILASEHVFPGHRTKLVDDLITGDGYLAPDGLRLVEEWGETDLSQTAQSWEIAKSCSPLQPKTRM